MWDRQLLIIVPVLSFLSQQQQKLIVLHFTSWENATMWVQGPLTGYAHSGGVFCFNHCRCLWFSTEFMFIHSNGGQRRPSKPRPLRPHRIRDYHRRLCCQDSQNTAGGGHHGGTAAVLKTNLSQWLQLEGNWASLVPRQKHFTAKPKSFFWSDYGLGVPGGVQSVLKKQEV